MKENKKIETPVGSETPQAPEQIFIARFGKNGKEVAVSCKRAKDGKFVDMNGEEIPEWAEIEL